MPVILGPYSYMDRDMECDSTTVNVGAYCSIGSGVTALSYPQHRKDWVSTFPFPSSDHGWPEAAGIGGTFAGQKHDITIGSDVWIGSDVVLLAGADIGDGAVIGSRSLVAGHIEPYSIAVGNPCRGIKYRFTREQIDQLMAIHWWTWEREKIVTFLPLLCSTNVDAFIKAAKNG